MKIFVFVVGAGLLLYVGGTPEETAYFFLSHLLFIVPYLLDFYPYRNSEEDPSNFYIWWAGFAAVILNLFGTLEVIYVEGSRVYIDGGMALPGEIGIPLNLYVWGLILIYGLVFMKTCTSEKTSQTVSNEVTINDDTKNIREGLRENVANS